MPQRRSRGLAGRRVGAWLAWWVLLMSFWMILDDSAAPDEVLAGAATAAAGASTAQWVTGQAGARFRIRARWLAPAARLPWEVVRDTGIVFAALWRRVIRGEQPASRLREIPARQGGTDAASVTRRVLLVAGRSLAPNAFAVGLPPGRDVLVVHELVPPGPRPGPGGGG
jgi:Zn-dependent protease with chaperone function